MGTFINTFAYYFWHTFATSSIEIRLIIVRYVLCEKVIRSVTIGLYAAVIICCRVEVCVRWKKYVHG